jgi:predicted DNA-binding transcriptional regulator AlpA
MLRRETVWYCGERSGDAAFSEEVSMKLLRYPDLVSKGVVRSRMTLWRLIKDEGFPAGALISPNARVWDEAEVDAWISARPSAKKVRGGKREATAA